jgi:RNA polymerase sigma-70 factor (ECF subfamily)
MNEGPLTQPSLLLRLRDTQDAEAWGRFVDLYAPVVFRYLKHRGLQDADAGDVAQDVLQAIAASIGRLDYDRQRGTFRAWLLTLTRNKLCDFLERQYRQTPGTGDSEMLRLLAAVQSPSDSDAAMWDAEYEQRLFESGVELIRGDFQESTWQAFWRTSVDGKDPSAVADELNLSVGAVYTAKSRVLARLKRELQNIANSAEGIAGLS